MVSASRGPTVTVPETGSMSSTNRGFPSAAGTPSRSPRRWPMVNAVGAVVPAQLVAGLASTIAPPWLGARSPSFSRSQPALSPSATKQMSWESGFSATSSPRRAASSRITDFGVSPSGNSEWASCSWVSTPST